MSLPHYLIQNDWGTSRGTGDNNEDIIIEINNNQNKDSEISGRKTGLNICSLGDNPHLASQRKQMV